MGSTLKRTDTRRLESKNQQPRAHQDTNLDSGTKGSDQGPGFIDATEGAAVGFNEKLDAQKIRWKSMASRLRA